MKWLTKKLDTWVNQGLLSSEQSQKIFAFEKGHVKVSQLLLEGLPYDDYLETKK